MGVPVSARRCLALRPFAACAVALVLALEAWLSRRRYRPPFRGGQWLLRGAALARPRDPGRLAADVSGMRARMRAELDRGRGTMFDLKQGEGGLVDLEFLLQAQVLAHSAAHPALLAPRSTPALLDACRAAGLLDEVTCRALLHAHARLVALGLDRTLDRRLRLVPQDSAALAEARAAIGDALVATGLAPAAAVSSRP